MHILFLQCQLREELLSRNGAHVSELVEALPIEDILRTIYGLNAPVAVAGAGAGASNDDLCKGQATPMNHMQTQAVHAFSTLLLWLQRSFIPLLFENHLHHILVCFSSFTSFTGYTSFPTSTFPTTTFPPAKIPTATIPPLRNFPPRHFPPPFLFQQY